MPTRRAHTVHLTAPTEALVRRGALLLEDALHTASLPEGSQLLLIRHLEVGRIHPRRSSATLALTIEQQLQRLVPIPASDPAAARAAAVFFADDLEPYTLLCQHLTQGHPPTAWFWRAAVPQWQPYQPAAETYRHLLLHLAQQPQGTLALAHLLHHLQHHQTLTPLLASLTPQVATLLLTLCHLSPSPSPPPSLSRTSPHPPIAPSPQLTLYPTLTTWLPTWGDDVRSHWLTLIALIHANPSRYLSPHLPTQAQTLIHQILSESIPLSASADALADVRQTPRSRPDPAPPATPPQTPASAILPPSPSPVRPSARPPIALSTLALWHPTSHGGFFFTINLLERLKFPQYLTDNPDLIEAHFPTHLLLTLAQRLAIPPEDPIFEAIGLPPSPYSPISPHPWLRLLSRWCRRSLAMDLPGLATRPGELRITPTHWDLRLGLEHSDIRIRRTGLDLDPGWVPWLGRVIAFHYHGGSTHAV